MLSPFADFFFLSIKPVEMDHYKTFMKPGKNHLFIFFNRVVYQFFKVYKYCSHVKFLHMAKWPKFHESAHPTQRTLNITLPLNFSVISESSFFLLFFSPLQSVNTIECQLLLSHRLALTAIKMNQIHFSYRRQR